MRLRPLAPLAVVGAGLLVVTLATHAASADAGEAPEGVQIAVDGSALVVSWQAPDGSTRPDHYGVIVTGGDGAVVADREVAGDQVQATLTVAALDGSAPARVVVSAEYGGSHVDAAPLQVVLRPVPVKPELAPALRVSGRTLTVRIPKTATVGVTARTVRILRDGAAWASVAVPAGRTTVITTVPSGSDYAAQYRNESAAGAGGWSEATVAVAVRAGGPDAVTQLAVERAAAGLRVSWLAPAPQAADVASYSVKVLQNGHRVGSSWAAADQTAVLIPVQNLRGPVVVTVKAKDVDGVAGTSTKTVDLGE